MKPRLWLWLLSGLMLGAVVELGVLRLGGIRTHDSPKAIPRAG